MDSVRTPFAGCRIVVHRRSAHRGAPHPHFPGGSAVLDLIYLAATIALFAIVGLAAKGAEKL